MEKVTYIEPFAGGAGAALALLMSGKVERIVINDLDKTVYSFWNSSIFHSARFIRKIESTPVTIAEWKKQKEIYSNPKASEFNLGFATFFLNRTNTSGILDGGVIGGIEQKGKYKVDARFNKKALIERIKKISAYKDKISVFNEDGLKLINKYLSKKNVFIYLDPPYFEKGASLYLNHYREDNHEALAKKLNQNPDAFWLLTYDNKKEIKSLYPNRRIVNFSLNYNAYKSRKGKELMIFSDAFAK
ncbi:MAG: D12 class N6 adenine-specific DNA methyltransferase [Candidatus Falkowbacteria bacterium GW2011_GWC2_38_22]|nr:MAG: D12 class N6 adenine-specific DNA methyltransferase [Candidatus Falkowbacteria bacterium GW2011_GWC2_38_22]